MTKLTYCLRRKPGMTWQEFSEYWGTVHAPLVAARAEVLGIKRYVQVRTQQNPGLHAALQARNGGSPEPYDGIAELWFEPVARGERSEAATKAGRELLEDERNFIDLPNSPIWYGEETEVVALH
ncbi:MAG: EthD domain-containing protein [bacterium]